MNIRRVLGWGFIAAGLGILFLYRYIGRNLAEGQLFFEYWPYWIFSAALSICGCYILEFKK